MSNIDTNIEKLQKLFEAGVITKDELDKKKADLISEPTEEELSELTDLLEKELISKDEFDALKEKKKKEAVAAIIQSNTSEKATLGNFIKKNLAFLIIIAALVATLGIVGSKLASMQKTINDLNEKLSSSQQNAEYYQKETNRLQGYKYAIYDFYLDGAVVSIDGDSKYYHRYNCPKTPMKTGDFSYWTFNELQAQNEGLSACPSCFSLPATEYCHKYIEN